jgi:uncharacterized protein YkvS
VLEVAEVTDIANFRKGVPKMLAKGNKNKEIFAVTKMKEDRSWKMKHHPTVKNKLHDFETSSFTQYKVKESYPRNRPWRPIRL